MTFVYSCILDGRKRASRGRFECAFSQIGGSVMAGAAIGGIYGGYNGLKLTSTLNLGLVNKAIDSTASASTTTQTLSWAVRRSQILNYILKTGALTANTFGLVALVYSAADVGISYYLENDDVNSIAAGTVAGIVYRGLSTPEVKADGQNSKLLKVPRWQIRLRRGAIGGLIGLSLSSAFVLVSHRDKIFKK